MIIKCFVQYLDEIRYDKSCERENADGQMLQSVEYEERIYLNDKILTHFNGNF